MKKKQLGFREFDGTSHGKEDVVPQLDIVTEFREERRCRGKHGEVINCGVGVVDEADIRY